MRFDEWFRPIERLRWFSSDTPMHVSLVSPCLPVHCHRRQSVCHGSNRIGRHDCRGASWHGLKGVEQNRGLHHTFPRPTSRNDKGIFGPHCKNFPLHSVQINLHIPIFCMVIRASLAFALSSVRARWVSVLSTAGSLVMSPAVNALICASVLSRWRSAGELSS